MIKQKTITKIYNRSRMICECCNHHRGEEFHHVFFKSHYFKKDRDLSWNISFICRNCHREIHDQTTIGKFYDLKLKKKSLHRKWTIDQRMKNRITTLEIELKEVIKTKKIIDKFGKK